MTVVELDRAEINGSLDELGIYIRFCCRGLQLRTTFDVRMMQMEWPKRPPEAGVIPVGCRLGIISVFLADVVYTCVCKSLLSPLLSL
jgi:hypothetical protein